jgi:hypothetical protein
MGATNGNSFTDLAVRIQALIDERVAPDLLDFKEDIITAVLDLVDAQVRTIYVSQRIARVPVARSIQARSKLHLNSVHVQTKKVKHMERDTNVELERIIYERDLQRTRWLIKEYYRTRIHKLEKHVQFYLHHEEYTRRLSHAELEYAKEYFTSIGRYTIYSASVAVYTTSPSDCSTLRLILVCSYCRHASQLVLKDLPPPYQSFVKSSNISQEEDMIPEPDLEHNVMMRPSFDSVQINPSAGAMCVAFF